MLTIDLQVHEKYFLDFVRSDIKCKRNLLMEMGIFPLCSSQFALEKQTSYCTAVFIHSFFHL
uniref:Uncharacterized protein n=1 Tax=Anguilla anguilla TaxID=7936 RepID=A0A0E9XD45_ANGAN